MFKKLNYRAKNTVRLSSHSFLIGLLSLFLLTAAVAVSLLAPVASSANADSPTEFVLQTPTDSVLRVSIITNDIIFNPTDQMIYASRPSNAGSDGNSLTRINPLTGQIGASVYVGSEPNIMALSDNGQTLYVTLDGAYAIRRYETSTHAPGQQFSIGRESTSSNPLGAPYRASAIAVAPGNPNLLAVSRYLPGISPPGTGVAIFNNGVKLPQTGPGHSDAANYLSFSSSAATLYGGGYSGGLRSMTVNENGVNDYVIGTAFSVKNLKYENNRIFTSTGQVINAQTRELLGTCAGVSNTDAFVPDTATGRVLYAMKETSSSNVTIKACDINTFTQIGSMSFPINPGSEPTTLLRYGSNGLAMRTWDHQIYLIQTSLIPTENPLPTPTGTPNVTPTPTPTVYARFIRQVTLPTNDIIYSRTEQKFYASVSNTPASANANSVARINPTTAAVESSVVVGNNPGRLALSDDDETLYVGINGANAVRKFNVATQTPGLQFPLGAGVNGPKIAHDIDVMPGNSNSVAVSYGSSSYNYDGADIYDEGVKRAQKAPASGSVEFASPSVLYVGENWLYKYAVSPIGLTGQGNVTTNNYLEAEFSGNLLYNWNGGVMELESADFKGSFWGLGYPSVMTVDVANNRAFFLTYGDGMGGNTWSIRAYRLDNFLLVGSISLPPSVTITNDQRRLFRWGDNGLAFRGSSDKLYFLQTDLVNAAAAVPTGLQLSSSIYSNNEGAGSLPVTVIRSGGLTGTTTVDYAAVDGTASAGTDFTATAGTLVFAPGETSKTINIPLINDNVYEGNETFGFVLSNAGGGGTTEIQTPSTASLTINDNDSQPAASTANINVQEPRIVGTTTALFTVQLSNPTVQTVTVNYATSNGTATAGSDYIATSGTLTFAPLETTKTVSVQVLADNNFNEPNETFRLNFSSPVNVWLNNPQVTAVIINFNLQAIRHDKFDFDGDGLSDIGVFRPSNGNWYINQSQAGFTAAAFGLSVDKLVPSDYDGDGKADIAVFRDGAWYLQRSALGYFETSFGISGDIPQPADFDGDGRSDIAVFRPSDGTWYVLNLYNNQFNGVQFGAAGDIPAVADYDGDGKADYAVYRPSDGTWYLLRTQLGFTGVQFGISTDKPVVGDYDGDGRADQAVYRDGVWYQLRSSQGFTAVQFGIAGDLPAPADFDGDGKTDPAVYRDNTWYLLRSTGGFTGFQFGAAGDRPVSNAYVP